MLASVGDRLDEGQRGLASLWRAGLRPLAIALLVVYLVWNLFWLGQGRIPPSLFLAITGLPAPTTGGVRSLAALGRGDWRASLEWNALALPMAGLFVFCLGSLAWCAARRSRLRLPPWTLAAWIGVLSGAWLVKLVTL